MATSANADVNAVNLPDPTVKVNPIADLMKTSEFDEVPLKPEPIAETKPVENPPVAAVAETTPTSFDHPRTMVRRALAMGASMAEIKATSPAQLDEWIDANETIAAIAPKPDAEVVPVDPYGIEAMLKENPDFDTPMLKVVRKIAESADAREARIATLEAENKAVKAQLQKEARSKGADAIDEVFATLSPKVFGSGHRSALDKNSSEAKRRLAVVASAGIVKGDSDVVVKQKIKAQAESLFGAAPAETPADSNGTPRITPDQWNKAGLTAPTTRVVNEPAGVNAAYKAVRELMIEKQMFDSDDESAAHLRVPK